MGVICYVLLAGYPPFYDEDQKKLFRKIKDGKYHFHHDYWCNTSPDAIDMIKRMLCVSQQDRWFYDFIILLLYDEWMNEMLVVWLPAYLRAVKCCNLTSLTLFDTRMLIQLYTTLHFTGEHCTTLHSNTLHYTILHYTTLHYTTLLIYSHLFLTVSHLHKDGLPDDS